MTDNRSISPELLKKISSTYEILGSYRLICAIYEEKRSEKSLLGWLMIYSPDISKQIGNLLDGLTEQEATTLKLYYGLEGQFQTYQEIGDFLDWSRFKISRIEKKAMRKLRHPTKLAELSRLLTDFGWPA